jgi:zinc D-Ala-D-Ala carboxypeptidase
MTFINGISSVASRIGEIEARMASINPSTSADSSLEGAGPPDPTAGFDPFGAAYQQALDGTAANSTAPQASPTYESSAAYQSSNSTITGAVGSANTRLSSVLEGAVLMRPRVESMAPVSGATSGSSVGVVGGYGAMPVPADLAAYGNGNIPAAALEPIGQGAHRLWRPAADAWKQAVAAAKADGIDLTVTDSYRSFDQQQQLAATKGLYANGGLGAVPGTSNHGWGVAVDADITNPATKQWLQANGHRFGFVEAVPREPWHWEYRPTQA